MQKTNSLKKANTIKKSKTIREGAKKKRSEEECAIVIQSRFRKYRAIKDYERRKKYSNIVGKFFLIEGENKAIATIKLIGTDKSG